ncbi:SPOR domain-containing protein [Comamonas terrigena]|uniref:SPOR domain-containing protein n=1 Tax=Comamonas terrigena TaxID=32013 RepID=UPI00244AA53A|nr:SPOR domain-containing protein [Comamonas terrigena]MDH1292605.1 SPOR domain-containing protein [Comamonas terrigena]
MLRHTLLALLLANAGYLAWSQGWMASLGWQPETQSEAFRLKQQMRPEAIQVGPVTPPARATPAAAPATDAAAPAAPDTASGPGRCWQAGTFDDKQVVAVRTALRDLEIPAEQWELQTSAVNGRWMVYLGKFPSAEALDARRAELRQQGVGFDRATGALEPGLSLGRFPSEEAATRELTTFLRKGVRGARVVQERAETTLYTLRLPHVSPELHARMERLKPALAGKPLRLCEG